VVDCLLKLYPFKIIYLADLNALISQGDNNEMQIATLLQAYPQITFWVDSGYQLYPGSLSTFDNYQIVLGSESYSDAQLNGLNAFEKNFILSLDFSAQGKPLGAQRLFTEPNLWPKKVILMTLARVGSSQGVDLNTLIYYQQLTATTKFIASGGIRTIEDVLQLQKIGIQQVLCASALHNNAISRADLEKL
jgi:phosphoribosylformimino-5-aminoimidazole carboxamide ribotide isomerase